VYLTSDAPHQSHFSHDDLKKLTSIVRANASAALNADDVEDITGEILLSASITAANASTTAGVAALAFSYARLPRYYAERVRHVATVLPYDPLAFEWSSHLLGNATLSVEVRRVLYALGAASRTLIWLCDVEGRTLAETGTLIGVSTATAYRRLSRAHDDFRAAWTA
jgi:DNA-directed RNA polymerase specialized sigma24 family protein